MAIRMFAPVLAIFLVWVAIPAVAGELVIVASSAPDLKPGQIIKTDAVIQVPSGTSITIVSQTGKLLTLKGPYTGPPGPRGQGGGDKNLISSLSNLLLRLGEETSIGGSRAGRGLTAPSEPWAISVHRSGHFCYQAAASAKLWRAKTVRNWNFSLKNMVDKTKLVTNWPAGSETLDWPSKVTLGDGVTYMARRETPKFERRLVLHRVPPDLPTDVHKAAWMAEKGCLDQAKRLLARLR